MQDTLTVDFKECQATTELSKRALEGQPIASIHGWSNSMVTLCWILNTTKEWKQFISNRVQNIKEKKEIKWHCCPTSENLADLDSMGSTANSLGDLWWKGPQG